jgi:predicted RNA-binding Zn-ribbon protein involved in translation (DUF1610 family)
MISAIIHDMDTPLPAQILTCSQCGGELHPDEGQIFLTCPYCSATVYIDKARVVFHWYLAPTLDEQKAQAALMRWMAGNQTVKDLDRKATVTNASFEYFPLWYFKRRSPDGFETITLEPAAATSITEIENLNLPAGDLRKYDSSIDAQAHQPTVPLQTALGWMGFDQIPQNEIAEQALVHIPLYTFKYAYRGNAYTALVEAATGSVFANIYPAKAETPYRAIGLITAAVFLCLSIIPLVMSLNNSWEGTGLGLLICAGLGIVFVPLLFAIAAYVAAKV